MKEEFILDAFVKPFVLIAFFVAFGAGFIFGGYQTISVISTKRDDGNIIFDYTVEHFWGYIKFPHHIEQVKKAEIFSSRGGSHANSGPIVSNVYLVSDTQTNALLGGSSNINGNIKREIADKINAYLQSPIENSFSAIFRIRDIFYWIGLPLFVIGILSVMGWPKRIIDAFIKYRRRIEATPRGNG